MTAIKTDALKISGDELHNLNCHEFLTYIWEENPSAFLSKHKGPYNPNIAYGDLYTQFLTKLEEDIKQNPNKERTALLNAIFLNESKLLERAETEIIMPILKSQDHFTFSSFETAVTTYLNKNQKKKNTHTPQGAGSLAGRAWSSVGQFSPMKETSIPCVKKYDYQTDEQPIDKQPIEIRMGTQAECLLEGEGYTLGVQTRINPLFNAWIKNQKENDEKITHVYFNLLGRDRSGYEGKREEALTHELEILGETHPNIAVITLPADQGLMDKKAYQSHTKDRTCNTLFQTMLNIASGKEDKNAPAPDFYISEKVKAKLYDPRSSEETKLKELLKASFKTILNIDNAEKCEEKISEAQLQAVYFHFIKYELTNFILEKLQPTTFNTSCKDGIDRGGVASLYYNLMKSIKLGSPLSETEFQRGLHAAPTIVKGRGINHHGNLIWNAVHHYVEQHKADGDKTLNWLIKWRNDFAPSDSKTLPGYIQQLSDYKRVREKKDEYYHYFSTHSKTTKTKVAEKLIQLIENPQNVTLQFAPHELSALRNGTLGKLVCDMATNGINLKPIYKQQEPIYKQQVTAYQTIRTKEEGSFNSSLFGQTHGLSKAIKLAAAKKLWDFIDTGNPQKVDSIEWRALHNGRLGKIVKAMEKDGYDFSKFRASHSAPQSSNKS